MRKLFFTLLLSLTALTSSAQMIKLGDVDRDDILSVADVTTLVDIILNGYSPFSLSPTEVTMQVGETSDVTIFGGYYVYEVESANPDIVTASLNGLTVTLTAVAGGETSVTVKDVLTFRTIDIPVVVNDESLQVSSNELSLIAGERGTVEINTGSGYYSVQSSDENVATATVSGGTVTVTAVGTGSANITITDINTEKTAVINVKVGYMPIVLSSSSLGLSIGDESRVSVTSGSGSYDVQSSDTYVATAVMEGSSVVVTAVGGGTATITVTDTNGDQSATITVTVEYFPLTLSASSLELNIGDEETVNITSGNASFTVTCSDTGVATAKLVGFSIKVTAVYDGTATITVTDRRSGETAAIEVTVDAYLTCPDDHHPHKIDLGLPSGTKWACCNVDTDYPEKQSPTNYGGYYAWGETETKSYYEESTYQHYKNGSYLSIGSDIAGTEYDVAHVKWGGSWVMASHSQQQELFDNCTSTWTTQNGVSGRLFTGTNGGSIFLPAAGDRYGSDLECAGEEGYYWSSWKESSYIHAAYCLYFYSGRAYWTDYFFRFRGHSVRPVFDASLFLLSSETLSLHMGATGTVEVTSGLGDYAVSSSDEGVATAVVEGSQITVTATGAGDATITVRDTKSGQEAAIVVSVSPCPDDNHPHMIDLGLPSGVLWSCCNVGADKPEAYGGYYAWGETEEKEAYNWSTYKWCNGSNTTMTKYCTASDYGTVDGKTVLDPEDDVAHVKWGGDWRMPTREEQDELFNECTYEGTSLNGVNGKKFTGPNGNSLFLPVAGYYWDDSLHKGGNSGYYWSSTQDPSVSYDACRLLFRSGDAYWVSYINRFYGLTVRPVSR